MKFYLTGLGNLYENLEEIKRSVILADELGFDGALMPDHYMWGSEIGHTMRDPNSTLETWTTLTYLAGKTERISLGTLVTPLPLRHPGVLAKRLSTLDILSGGRVVLGVGAGWSRVEFDGYSRWLETGPRVEATVEALEVIRRLWTEPEVNFEGEYYEVKGAVLDPKPLQKPHPRLLFGSQGRRMLRLTGMYGDICFIPPWAVAKQMEIKDAVLEAAEEAGRIGRVAFMGGLMGVSGQYSSDEYARLVESQEMAGSSYCAVAFPRGSAEAMRLFAEKVMPSYR
jgi:alkanesulfonate monooxygenase SsuD/methylene tetrahydromethanopterin reductase-like flavin-dependent oxidoreductase (luciferase family)